ncbi:MAG: lysophospholipid acyltransferase family protein [Patescibacteria group bacterium]
MSIEKFGQFIGKTVGKLGFEHLKSKIENFDIKARGFENFDELEGEAYLLVANHIIPKDKKALETGISPDAFILQKLVEDNTNRKIKIANKADNGRLLDSEFSRNFQKNIGSPFMQGFLKGVGNIPVQKDPGSFNRNFLEIVDETIKNNEPILMFPEGHWYQDFSTDHELESGAAHIAKKYGIKIIPVYITGADSWQGEQKVEVLFGESFSPGDLSKEGISEKISERIGALQKELKGEK